jgi:hypothetical protein
MFGANCAPILRQDWYYLQTDQNELPLGVLSSASKTISEPMERSAQPMLLSVSVANTVSDQNNIPHDPRHLEIPSGASKTIFEPMVHLAQTVHLSCLSCIKISTLSKQTETSFHLSLVTSEYDWVHPK